MVLPRHISALASCRALEILRIKIFLLLLFSQNFYMLIIPENHRSNSYETTMRRASFFLSLSYTAAEHLFTSFL